jgi:hypothetical protein
MSETASLLFETLQASPACPSDMNSIKMKMSVKHWKQNTDRGKLKYSVIHIYKFNFELLHFIVLECKQQISR